MHRKREERRGESEANLKYTTVLPLPGPKEKITLKSKQGAKERK